MPTCAIEFLISKRTFLPSSNFHHRSPKNRILAARVLYSRFYPFGLIDKGGGLTEGVETW